jgi:serine/threonine protein kinase
MSNDEQTNPHRVAAQTAVRHTTPPAAEVSTEPTADTLGGLSERSLTFGLSQAQADQPDPLLGVQLGDIQIGWLIAEGGMGRVYLGRQQKPSRAVAVKFMRHGRSAAALERFHQEAEVLGRLSHPGIARVFSAGSVRIGLDDVPYSVMEYIPDAAPLVGFCDARESSIDARVRLFLQTCDAVAYAHTQGVVHRDLKPGNILVTLEGGGADGRACVIDFGIAKLLATEAEQSVTSTGEFLGTRRYMSPEQLSGSRVGIDARTDVYALGVILHELATGRLPYDVEGCTIAETARIVGKVRPRSLDIPAAEASPLLRQGLQRIAACCLQKSPDLRYPSAVELADDVRGLLAGVAVPQRHNTSRRLGIAVLAASFCITLAVSLPWLSGSQPPPAATSAASLKGVFVNIQSPRTSPVAWTSIQFSEPVDSLDIASLSLTRDGREVDLSGCELIHTSPESWRLDGLTACNEQEGHYVLTVLAGERSPADIAGHTLSQPLRTAWTMPPYKVWKLSLADDRWREHVVSMEGLEAYTEQSAGKDSFLRPIEPHVAGTLILRFESPFAIDSARLFGGATHVWTTGDPFPYDPGARASVDISSDGSVWTTIDQREAGNGGSFFAETDISAIVAGSREVWVRVRLTATIEWPGDGLIYVQFLRTHDAAHPDKASPFTLQVAAAQPSDDA